MGYGMTTVDIPSESDSRDADAPSDRARGLPGLLGGWRLRPIWICSAVLLAVFTLVRLGLLLAKYEAVTAKVGSGQIVHCFLMGGRYDAMPIGYAMLPMVVLLSLAGLGGLRHPRLRKAVVIYAAAIVTIAIGTEAFGFYFFLRFGRRLNYIAFAYLVHRETLQYMWNRYPMWGLIPFIPGVFYVTYRLFRRWFWRGTGRDWSLRRRLIAAAALLTLCVLACRGGLERRPLRRGSAYFSGNLLIDELAMNDFFTMFHAARSELADGQRERETYPLPSLAEASAVACEMLFQATDAPGEHPANPLWRISHSPHRRRDLNVVVIIMEGMSGRFVGALGHQPSQTPQLDALCREGLFLERMYAVGPRTSRGMVGVLCGHPDLGGTTLMKRSRALGRFLTLPAVLQERGYHTMFIYGGRPEFDNMGEFFGAGGVDETLGQDDMGDRPGNWGVPDETIFRRAHERFEEMKGRRFFAAVLTVSNHTPYEIPAGRCEMLPVGGDDDEQNRKINAYRYADWALGEYFRYARRSRYFENTIFVLVADHGRDLDQSKMVDVPGFRIPCLIYAPGIVAPACLPTVAGQMDIAPTLLALLGGQYEHCFLGRNVLEVAEDDGFALLHEDVHLAFVRDDLALTMAPRPNSKPTLFRLGATQMVPVAAAETDPNQVATLQREMLSYYEMARHLYVAGAYCDPERYAETTTAPTGSDGPD
jgi:phosphoglycerol transferase MdoB-like AlkP superfamily enzyme